jgi:hypothetical protein
MSSLHGSVPLESKFVTIKKPLKLQGIRGVVGYNSENGPPGWHRASPWFRKTPNQYSVIKSALLLLNAAMLPNKTARHVETSSSATHLFSTTSATMVYVSNTAPNPASYSARYSTERLGMALVFAPSCDIELAPVYQIWRGTLVRICLSRTSRHKSKTTYLRMRRARRSRMFRWLSRTV